MNPIIKSLAEKATTTTHVRSHGAFGENESYDVDSINIELFAKLVIAECCKIIDPTDNMKVSIETECALYTVIEEINEKFK